MRAGVGATDGGRESMEVNEGTELTDKANKEVWIYANTSHNARKNLKNTDKCTGVRHMILRGHANNKQTRVGKCKNTYRPKARI